MSRAPTVSIRAGHAPMMGHGNELTSKRIYARWLDPEVIETTALDAIWGSAACVSRTPVVW